MVLSDAGLDPPKISVPKLKKEYERMQARKDELGSQLRRDNAEQKKLNKYLSDHDTYMSGDCKEREKKEVQNKKATGKMSYDRKNTSGQIVLK